VTVDIDEGKKAEEQAGLVAQLQAILNVLPTYTWYAAPSGGLTFVNKRTADYLGVPKDHPQRFGIDIGAQWDDWVPLLHPDDQEESRQYWSNCLRTGEAGEHSYRVRSAQGDYRWFLTRFEPLRARDGTLLLWVGATLDIEELKRAEQALRESEYGLRQITTAACRLRILSIVVGRPLCTRPTFQKLQTPSITQFRPELRTRVSCVCAARTASFVGTMLVVSRCVMVKDALSSGTACLLILMKARRPKTGYAAAKPIWRIHRG
jgi:hypothetical protein